jgi:hypothetical protein
MHVIFTKNAKVMHFAQCWNLTPRNLLNPAYLLTFSKLNPPLFVKLAGKLFSSKGSRE